MTTSISTIVGELFISGNESFITEVTLEKKELTGRTVTRIVLQSSCFLGNNKKESDNVLSNYCSYYNDFGYTY